MKIIPLLSKFTKIKTPAERKAEEQQLQELDRLGEEGKLVLRTSDLVKKYRQRTVVNHVSINVRQGEIVGLLDLTEPGKPPHSI